MQNLHIKGFSNCKVEFPEWILIRSGSSGKIEKYFLAAKPVECKPETEKLTSQPEHLQQPKSEKCLICGLAKVAGKCRTFLCSNKGY